ncbi:MAG: bile acid:sodium symporter family protein [Planctomycetales bacterium]
MLERYLIVWLTLLSGLAFFWPGWFPTAPDPFTATKPVLPYLISITMFSVGCLMRRDELRQVIRDWRSVLAGTVLQYTATPLMAYGFGRLFGLDEGHFIGVVIVGCVPGAMASNILTMVARGNVSYSVSLTTVSTLLSPVVVPLAMSLCLKTTEPVDLWGTARELIVMVVGPVVLGRILCRFIRGLDRAMEVVAPLLAPVTILWIIAVVVGLQRDKLTQGVAAVVAALACINLFGYLVGYWGGAALRFPEGVRRALTIEIGMQNAGLGVALAARLFPEHSEAMIPPALFTIGSMVTATILVQWWAWRARQAEAIP